VTGPVESLTYSTKNIEPGKPILIAGKDVLSLVTMRGDMVQTSSEFESQGTSHTLYPESFVAAQDPLQVFAFMRWLRGARRLC
jgi:hypothetical protein